MLLVKSKIGPFKSIETPATTQLDPQVTVLVGMNEAGKTAFLQALYKAASIEESVKYKVTEDYPRKNLTSYQKKAEEDGPDEVVILTYRLEAGEIDEINKKHSTSLKTSFEFSLAHTYANKSTVSISIDETPVIASLLASASLSGDSRKAAAPAKSIVGLVELLKAVPERTPTDDEFLAALELRIKAASDASPGWKTTVVAFEVWTKSISSKVPKFLYFDDYYLLPGKVNLPDLQQRVSQAIANPSNLEPKHRAVIALLRMAEIKLEDLTNPDGYEEIKAKLEAISNSITDQVFNYWKQNDSLEVEFDIRPDPVDQVPFNSGPNLYIRIRNKKHRVTVPFEQRSKGFIWFFSFLVWFDAVQYQTAKKSAQPLVLLLDEPGLSLHALAQADFLAYIDELARKHQVIYTTHSPFMIHSDRLHQVRIVEDKEKIGTTVSENLSGSNPKTIFPLQAALGYSIAQNLFISKRNLLVEGPADLIYLKHFSEALEAVGRTGLRDDITIVPTGGLDKVATFVALLGGNSLEFAVVYDHSGKPEPHIDTLIREKLLPAKSALTYAKFTMTPKTKGAPHATLVPSDVEDMFSVGTYLDLFNATFVDKLGGQKIAEKDLPTGDRIVERLNRHLATASITIRPSGGFNHYSVASYLASHPPKKSDSVALDRFEDLFKSVNALFSAPE